MLTFAEKFLFYFPSKFQAVKKSARFSVSWEIIWKNGSHKNHEFCREVLQVLRNFCGISVEFGGEKKAFSLHAVQDIVKAFSDFPYQQISVEWFLEKDLIHGLSEFWTWNWGLPKEKSCHILRLEKSFEKSLEIWKKPFLFHTYIAMMPIKLSASSQVAFWSKVLQVFII